MQRQLIVPAVESLLKAIEGPTLRKDLIDTPDRVYRALEEMLSGYETDIDSLFKTFDGEGTDQLVIVKNVEFSSFCEHHFLPFSGSANVAYLPNNKVIGASKIPRLVLAYAHRLQLQERIAEQVANTLMQKLEPLGVAVIIKGEHLCMRCRGVKSTNCSIINSIMLGSFRDNPALRMEVLELLR